MARPKGQSPKQRGRFTFNADKRAEEREASEIVIGSKTYHPGRLSNARMARWLELSPDQDEGEKRDPQENFDNLMEQIQVLILDEDGNEPTIEHLNEFLDVEQAGNLLALLAPKYENEDVRAGNLQAVGGDHYVSTLAVLMRFGGVSVAEFDEMDYLLSAELAKRMVDMYRQEVERDMVFQTELTKAIMRSNGAKLIGGSGGGEWGREEVGRPSA